MDLSIVIPIYNEEDSVEPLCEALHAALGPLNLRYEAVLVDDGSRDGTWDRLLANRERFPFLHLVRFRRNFGQTAAMAAGLDKARGQVIVTMDADLQNDPKDIPLLLERMTDDVDVVSGWRKDRQDKLWSRKIPSMLANKLISRITGVELHDFGCSLKAYRHDIIKDVRLYGEMHRFIPALAHWVGGTVVEEPVTHHARKYGESKYGIDRTLRVLLDLVTVKFLLRYSTGPMQILGKIGVSLGFWGGLLLAVIAGLNLFATFTGLDVPGATLIKRPVWPITGFMLVGFGIQFLGLGLLAEMMIRTYHESQDKRIYSVREEREPDVGSGA